MSKEQPRIVFYTKPFCPWCIDVKSTLDSRSLPYQVKDVTANAEHRDEMFLLTKQRKAPCLLLNDDLLIDTDAAALTRWLDKNGY